MKKQKVHLAYNIPTKQRFAPTSVYNDVPTLIRSLRQAVEGARECVPMINSTITNVCFDLVLGPDGLVYRPDIPTRDYKATDIDAERRIGHAIKKWQREASISGDTWIDIEQKIVSELFLKGEIFVLLTNGKIQILTADYRDLDRTDEKKNIYYGIKYDTHNKPVGYYFKGQYFDAESVLHIVDNNYVYKDTNIGIPRFAHILKEIDNLSELLDNTIIKSIFAAGISGFIQDESEYELEADDEDTTVIHNNLQPNEILELPPNKKFIQAKIEQDAGSVRTVLEDKNREIAKAIGFSVRAIFGDYNGLNYPALRTITNDDWIAARRVQNILIEKFYLPVYEFAVSHIITNQLYGITLPAAEIERFAGVDMIRPPKPAIDPTREAKALDMDIKAGRSTQTAQLAERGMTFEDWARQRKREAEILKKYGLEPATPEDTGVVVIDDSNTQ